MPTVISRRFGTRTVGTSWSEPPTISVQRRSPEGGPKARPEGLVRLERRVHGIKRVHGTDRRDRKALTRQASKAGAIQEAVARLRHVECAVAHRREQAHSVRLQSRGGRAACPSWPDVCSQVGHAQTWFPLHPTPRPVPPGAVSSPSVPPGGAGAAWREPRAGDRPGPARGGAFLRAGGPGRNSSCE